MTAPVLIWVLATIVGGGGLGMAATFTWYFVRAAWRDLRSRR